MDDRDGTNDETLPFVAGITVGLGTAPEARHLEISVFDRVVIPVRVEIPMTPELRARIERARGP